MTSTSRLLFALALAAPLAACVSETTSLGGPRGSQSSASSNDDDPGSGDDHVLAPEDAEASSGTWSPPAYDSMDAGRPGAWPCAYSWMPVPTSEACQYLLPTERQNGSTDLDPTTWDPRNVRVDVGISAHGAREIGGYKPAPAACGAEHGWYYLPPSDAPPTSSALCPMSCAIVSNGGEFRLSAFGWCGP
ncbi:MAG: hypothetical protein KF782_27095 [Labilithrix sp.]|nr:hypothetical protein [Labilithrix sp.]